MKADPDLEFQIQTWIINIFISLSSCHKHQISSKSILNFWSSVFNKHVCVSHPLPKKNMAYSKFDDEGYKYLIVLT